MFAGDDRYTTPDSSATALPTFLGNHDMGRIGYFLSDDEETLDRDLLAHDLMFLSRGQPVVYYGDEQGFAGLGGDKSARQTLFASQVDEYENQPLVTGETLGSQDRYDTSAPGLRAHRRALAAARGPPRARHGRADRALRRRWGRASTPSRASTATTRSSTSSPSTTRRPSRPSRSPTLTVRRDVRARLRHRRVGDDGRRRLRHPSPSRHCPPSCGRPTAPCRRPPKRRRSPSSVPVAGAALSGSAPVAADVDEAWRETSFAWRVVGSRRLARARHGRRHRAAGLPRHRRARERHARRVPRRVDGCRRPPLGRVDLRVGRQQGQPRRG